MLFRVKFHAYGSIFFKDKVCDFFGHILYRFRVCGVPVMPHFFERTRYEESKKTVQMHTRTSMANIQKGRQLTRSEIACHFKSWQDGKYKEKCQKEGTIKSSP
jgi:hypothetical protein